MAEPAPILVTGAAGFVGSHLLEELTRRPDPPAIVGWRRSGPRPESAPRPFPSAVTWQEVDVVDERAVTTSLAELRPRAVFHLAGNASVADSWTDTVGTLEVNVLGTRNVLRGLRSAAIHARVLVPGSAQVYRPKHGALCESDPIGPVTPYGLSKQAQEMQALRLATDAQQVIVTRSFTHIGPGQDLSYAASSFAHQIALIERGDAESVINVGLLDAHRDIIDVRDTVAAYRALMEGGATGIYNVCSGSTHQMRDIVVGLVELARVPIRIQLDPSRVRPSDYPELRGDRERITTEVGWEPRIELSRTLRDILDYWRGHMD